MLRFQIYEFGRAYLVGFLHVSQSRAKARPSPYPRPDNDRDSPRLDSDSRETRPLAGSYSGTGCDTWEGPQLLPAKLKNASGRIGIFSNRISHVISLPYSSNVMFILMIYD